MGTIADGRGRENLTRSKDVYWNGRARFGREIALTRIGIAVTSIATLLAVAEVFWLFRDGWIQGNVVQVSEQIAFVCILLGLVYGNLDYQISRVAYFRRLRAQKALPPAPEIDAMTNETAPSLTVLIPSYCEEARVIVQTILSGALQRYPNPSVVLLIDDAVTEDDTKAAEARAVVCEVAETLEKRAEGYRAERLAYLERRKGGVDCAAEFDTLARAYSDVASWFENRATAHPCSDHTDELFVELVLTSQALHYRSHSGALLSRPKGHERADEQLIDREYCRLAAVFGARVSSFERKRYANLSHEANKAMNLNSYLALMGRSFRVAPGADGETELLECPRETSELSVCAPEYVLTLDADSMLHPGYAERLMRIMLADESGRLAVVQTPYSAPPNPSRTIERVAGATTDVQYVIDQGSTLHGGTFWIGANALLRRAALEDIRVEDEERGYRIWRYIQDRTVIEDTESTVDLLLRGWKLHSHPERLSFSATPDDFGSLLIQRRRWANGGLIILPKLLRYLWRQGPTSPGAGEAFSRNHYLVSIPVVTAAVLALLFYPFEQNLWSIWFPLTAVPYFALYGRDLIQAGYPLGDLFRVYALNLMLLPINLGGVAKSVQQVCTGEKTPFGRTPKVAHRVPAPAGYVFAEYAIIAALLAVATADVAAGRWLHSLLGFFSAACFAYAVYSFIGVRASLQDMRRPLASTSEA